MFSLLQSLPKKIILCCFFFFPQEKNFTWISHSVTHHCFNSHFSCSVDSSLYYIKLHFCVDSTEKTWLSAKSIACLADSVILYSVICIYAYFILVKALQAFEGEVFLYAYLLHPVHQMWFRTSAPGDKIALITLSRNSNNNNRFFNSQFHLNSIL